MVQKREAYAPWSLTRKAGVQSATVNGDIEVPQFIQPTLNTGFVDEKGDWKGTKSSDEQFFAFGKDEGIPNTGEILAPQFASATRWGLDMTGFTDLFIAVRPTNGGNYAMTAVMAPATYAFANLRDVNAGTTLRGSYFDDDGEGTFMNCIVDASEGMTADVWNIYMIQERLRNYKLLQFKITNNSGGESDIETAFLRMV